MKCPNCGTEIANDSQFCEFCGAKINLVPVVHGKPKNYRPLWISLIVIIFISVLGIVAYNQYENVQRERAEAQQRILALEKQAEELRKQEEERKAEELRKEREKRDGVLIYQMLEERTCDGEYYGPDWEYDYVNSKNLIYTDLSALNFQHFRLAFDFMMIQTDNIFKKNILTIDSSYRIFGLEEQNGHIIITTDNWRHEYDTGIPIRFGQMMHVDLVYNRGRVIINGRSLNVIVENAYKGDRIFSTINFGGGRALYGKIRDVKVYNMID